MSGTPLTGPAMSGSTGDDVITATFRQGVGGYAGTIDTMIQSGSAKSAAKATSLNIDGGPDAAALLAWDLSTIPDGSLIESVSINLYVSNASKNPFAIYGLLQPWSDVATWSTTGAGALWSSAGAQGLSDRGAVVGQLSATKTGAATLVLDAGGVAMVQSWVDDPDSNHGIIFQNYNSSDGIIIASSESSQVTQRPQLTVSYRPSPRSPLNAAPVVNAGPDASLPLGIAASLAGSVTDDGQPDAVTSLWTRVSGPGTVTFGNAQSPTSTATFSAPGTYVLRLTATDGEITRWDEVTYVINSPIANQAPQVDAGNNQSVSSDQLVYLNGSVIDDGVAGPLTTTWIIESGPGTGTFGNASSVDTTVQLHTPGTYILRLVASDGEYTTSDVVTVTVSPGNLAPVVEAGDDQTLNFGVGTQLGGFVSDDGVGTGLTTLWTRVSGPGTVTFTNADRPRTMATFSLPGTYVLKLTASDGLLTSSDTLTIDVKPINHPPQVNAGPNLTVNVGSTLPLDGTVTDDGFSGWLTTQWVAIAGPGNVHFANASSVDTSVSFSEAGTYTLRLTASDGSLLGYDEIVVTVLTPSTSITAEFQEGVNGYIGTRDTEIKSGSSNRNFGRESTIAVDGKPDSSALLAWDLSSIPTGSVIVSASIELYISNASRETFSVYALDRAWDELSATWQRATSGSAWGTQGAQGSSDRTAAVGQLTASRLGSTTLELNSLGLAMIQAWIDNPNSNHGFIFQDYGVSDGLIIASSEASVVSRRPKLKLEFAPAVVPHSPPDDFFTPVEQTPIGQEQAIYPYGPNMAFGLYSVLGMNDYDPTKSNMQRVAEAGFNLVGPYNGKNWQTDFPLIHEASNLGLDFIYMVRQPPSLAGVAVADRPAVIAQLSDAEIAAYARTQVEAILNDPVARQSVKFWTTQPEETRYWVAEEMRYLRIATETIRQVEVERGEAHRPIWSYEPNHRPAEHMVITGQYQDIVSRGAYFTTRFDRGTDRAGWAMWSYQQIVQAANTLGNVPQAVFELLEDFTDPATAGSAAEITRVIRHDVYLALTMGIKGLNVFSMYEDRPNLTTHNEQFEAYATIAKDLLGELDLDNVLLTGKEMTDLEFSVASGPAQFDYLHQGTTPYTFDFLNTRHLAVGNERYVFLVNSAEAPMDVRIEGLPSQYVVDDLFAGTSTTGAGNMTVGLDVLGVKVLRFRPA